MVQRIEEEGKVLPGAHFEMQRLADKLELPLVSTARCSYFNVEMRYDYLYIHSGYELGYAAGRLVATKDRVIFNTIWHRYHIQHYVGTLTQCDLTPGWCADTRSLLWCAHNCTETFPTPEAAYNYWLMTR